MSDQVTVAEGHDEDAPGPEPARNLPDAADPAVETDPDATSDPAADRPTLLGTLTSTVAAMLTQVRSAPRLSRVLTLTGRALVLVLIAAVGGWLGAALAPSSTAYVGPLTAEIKVVPSLDPGVTVLLPPAGRVEFDTHEGPFAVEARVSEVDLESAKDLISAPGGLLALERSGPEALRAAVVHATVVTLLCALAGAVLLSLLWYRRRWLRTLEVAGAMVAILVLSGAVTAVSFDADRFASPKFSGLLSQAPYVAGGASSLLDRLESYRSGLADIVQGVTSLYATTGGLSGTSTAAQGEVTTLLHVSDIHLNPLAFDLIDRLVKQFNVDLVVDTGDIVTWGTAMESSTVARISDVPVPYVYVRGNHDSAQTQRAVAANKNAVVLDGAVKQVGDLAVAGIGDPRFTPNDEDARLEDAGSADAPDQGSDVAVTDERVLEQEQAGARLATAMDGWNTAHPQSPVQIAAVHEPTAIPALLGRVPLVLAGHTHKRSVRRDASGTLIMVEGSTGGAGITSAGLRRLTNGEPLPLSATLIYLAKTGPRRGHVVAYDEVTMGGFGLTSVTLQRHVVRADEERPLVPPSPSPSPAASTTTATAASTATATATSRATAATATTTRPSASVERSP